MQALCSRRGAVEALRGGEDLERIPRSGYLPLSVVLTSEDVFEAFYDEYSQLRAFLHVVLERDVARAPAGEAHGNGPHAGNRPHDAAPAAPGPAPGARARRRRSSSIAPRFSETASVWRSQRPSGRPRPRS